jgi:hypothetical protein
VPDPDQVTQGALAVQEIAKSVRGDLVAAFGTAKAAKGAQRLFGPAVDEVAEAMRRCTALGYLTCAASLRCWMCTAEPAPTCEQHRFH